MKTLLRTIQKLQPLQVHQIIYGVFMMIILSAALFALYNLLIGNTPI